MSSMDIGALLGQGGGQQAPMLGGQPDQQDQQNQQAPDPLQALQDAIHSVQSAIVALPDPKDTHDAVKALGILAGVQTRLMTSASPQG